MCGAVIVVMTVAVKILVTRYFSEPANIVVGRVYLEKLSAAHHIKSSFPAQRQTFTLLNKAGVRSAALNAIGREPREVRPLAKGEPWAVFSCLSHLGGFGEIIWVDEWTNFPVKLPARYTSRIGRRSEARRRRGRTQRH